MCKVQMTSCWAPAGVPSSVLRHVVGQIDLPHAEVPGRQGPTAHASSCWACALGPGRTEARLGRCGLRAHSDRAWPGQGAGLNQVAVLHLVRPALPPARALLVHPKNYNIA